MHTKPVPAFEPKSQSEWEEEHPEGEWPWERGPQAPESSMGAGL